MYLIDRDHIFINSIIRNYIDRSWDRRNMHRDNSLEASTPAKYDSTNCNRVQLDLVNDNLNL